MVHVYEQIYIIRKYEVMHLFFTENSKETLNDMPDVFIILDLM